MTLFLRYPNLPQPVSETQYYMPKTEEGHSRGKRAQSIAPRQQTEKNDAPRISMQPWLPTAHSVMNSLIDESTGNYSSPVAESSPPHMRLWQLVLDVRVQIQMSPMRGCNGSWGRFTLQPIHPWTSSAADAPSGGGVCLETIIRGVTQKGVVLLLSLLPACYESNAFPSPCLSESCVCLGAC